MEGSEARDREGLISSFRNGLSARALFYMLVPIVVVAALFLPPISLGNRLFHLDEPLITPNEGGLVRGPNSATLQVPPGAAGKRVRISMSALEVSDLANLGRKSPESRAAQEVPEDTLAYWPIYRLQLRGTSPTKAVLSLPMPQQLVAREVVDLFGWDGKGWAWLPSQLSADGSVIKAELDQVPSMVLIAQSQTNPPRISLAASLRDIDKLEKFTPTRVTLNGTVAKPGGGLDGDTPASSQVATEAPVLLSVRNLVDGEPSSDLVANLLVDADGKQAHIDEIVSTAEMGGYAGVELAYLQLDPSLRQDFSAFVRELARALHTEERLLAVRVDRPTNVEGAWDTGAYDWRAIGRWADVVRVPALINASAYRENGEMEQLLQWATGEVDRRKIELTISALSHDEAEGRVTALTYREAVGLLTREVHSNDKEATLLPGETVVLSLPELWQGEAGLDPDAQMYWFRYLDALGIEHTVWLETASSVARKLQLVARYALGGVQADDLLNPGTEDDVVDVVQAFEESISSARRHQYAFVWTVKDERGRTILQSVSPLSQPNMMWTAPDLPGTYAIMASVSDDGGYTLFESGPQLSIQVPTPTTSPTLAASPTPTEEPDPTATPTEEAEEAEVEETETLPAEEEEGEAEEEPTPPPPPPAVPPGQAAAGFGYGIQADMMTDGDHERIFQHINGMGFNWIKQQVEWFRYNPAPGVYDWGAIDRLVDGANAHGVNVLLSVVKAPEWARPPGDTHEGPPADPETYATFLRELAARYRGRVRAYEIWNEQNLYYEWGGTGNKLSAARYMELLRAAYNAIKSVDPGAVVISGALTPTGVNDGNIAIDDRAYLEQMYQNGLARYSDAIGAHPSGYNNPPDADWRTYNDDTGRCKGHPSWFFRSTMESYRNIMIKYGDGHKRIWATEFGWASVEGLGVGPNAGYEYAGDNSEAAQAQYIVRAYEIGRSWGWVGPMFLWNLNFAPVSGAGDEKAKFGIVRSDWSPRPAYDALAAMPK